jgi:CBS domain-containing protein
MTLPAISVPMTASLVEAARTMTEERIHRVVTTDERGRPVGVLSAMDFVRFVADGGLGSVDRATTPLPAYA